MGAAIASQVVARWQQDRGEEPVVGLVLEAAFNNLGEEVHMLVTNKGRGLQKILAPLIPVSPLLRLADLTFASDEVVGRLEIPVLLLHAEDDHVVPVELARRLLNSALKDGKQDIEMRVFDAEHCLGHSCIHKSVDLPDILKNFMERLPSHGGDLQAPLVHLNRASSAEHAS